MACRSSHQTTEHSRVRLGIPRDHVREGVVRTGRTSSNLGRQPDPSGPSLDPSHPPPEDGTNVLQPRASARSDTEIARIGEVTAIDIRK